MPGRSIARPLNHPLTELYDQRRPGQPLDPQSVTSIDTYSYVQAIGANSYRCTVNYSWDGGAGIRFNFALDKLVPNRLYRCDFEIVSINGDGVTTLLVDVCDDEENLKGPYGVGTHSFTFSRPVYTTTYRFVDIWVDEYEVSTEFVIRNLRVTPL